MVGDDLERDILASNRMGLQAFWLTDNGSESFDDSQAPSLSGKLEDVLPWIDQSPTEELLPDYSEPAAIVSTLRATAAALDSMCRNLPADVGAQRPAVDQWCISEILCHLRDVDREVNLPRLQKVLNENNAFISGVDTDPWAEQRGYILQNSSQALQSFIHTRIEFVELLEAMEPDDWRRTFRHAIFGPTHLQELVNIAASHDRLHIRQVREVLDALSVVY
jgi:hypothetical protein